MRNEALALITTASLLTGCSAVGMERPSESVETVTTTVTVNPSREVSIPENSPSPTDIETPLELVTPTTPKVDPNQPANPNKKGYATEPISEKRLGAFVRFVAEHGKTDANDPYRKIYTLHTKSGLITEYVSFDPRNSKIVNSITVEHGQPRGGTDSVEPMIYTESGQHRSFTDGYYAGLYDRGSIAGKPNVADGRVDKYSGYGYGASADPLRKTAEFPLGQDTSLAAQNAQRDYKGVITLTLGNK